MRCETGHVQDHASNESDKFWSSCKTLRKVGVLFCNESGHKQGVQREGEFFGQIERIPLHITGAAHASREGADDASPRCYALLI